MIIPIIPIGAYLYIYTKQPYLSLYWQKYTVIIFIITQIQIENKMIYHSINTKKQITNNQSITIKTKITE